MHVSKVVKMASMLERYLGRPIRETSWWMWFFLLPLAIWLWPFVVIYLIVRLISDIMQYAPSETRLLALAANDPLSEIPPAVGPIDADKERPAPSWWDLDSIPVGEEHNRPEGEWWNMGDVQVGSMTPPSRDNEGLIQFWSMVGLVFLLTFILLGANGAAFGFALLSTSVLLVIFYQIGPVRSMLGVE